MREAGKERANAFAEHTAALRAAAAANASSRANHAALNSMCMCMCMCFQRQILQGGQGILAQFPHPDTRPTYLQLVPSLSGHVRLRLSALPSRNERPNFLPLPSISTSALSDRLHWRTHVSQPTSRVLRGDPARVLTGSR